MTNPSKLLLLGLLCTSLPAFADWIPSSTGTYDYGSAANWAGGVINNVFLPDNYSGGAQTVTIGSDAVWNDDTGVTTSHGNGINLLLRATGSNRNLTLGGDINYVTTGSTANSFLQFGTVNNTEQINFALNSVVNINIQSQSIGRNAVIFNGVLSGAGGLTKEGNGVLYLQNAASTFTGPLDLTGGSTYLAGANGTIATQEIRITRQDIAYDGINTMANSSLNGVASSMTTLFLGNQIAPAGSPVISLAANANRISDTATVYLKGGTLRLYAANGADNNLTERIGTVDLDGGPGGLLVSVSGSGANVGTLNVGNLVRSSGEVLVASATNPGGNARATFGTGSTFEGRITIDAINGGATTSQLVNGILPWGVDSSLSNWDLWGGDFLTYGDYGLTAYTGFVSDINTATSTQNVKYTTNATLTTSTAINSLTLKTASLSGAGQTLTLTSGALNYYSDGSAAGAGNRTINANLNFNGQEALIFVQRTSLEISGNLTNTGGNGLTFTGIGYNNANRQPSLWLSGNNTYTGDTRVSGGILYINGTSALPSNSAVVINEGGLVDLRGNNISMASLSGVGVVRFREGAVNDPIASSTLTVGSNNQDTEFSGKIINSSAYEKQTGNLTKVGSGKLTLSGTNAYTGTTLVSAGSLIVNGSIASSSGVSVSSGASLGGSGHVSVISGAGLVGPGNSAGILTATSVNASAGLDFAFEFSLANAAPNYASATQSGNDVLRLTAGSSPFASALDSTNTISLYLDVVSLSFGDTFTGGFYVDSGDFLSSLSGATFAYYIADAGGSILYGGNRYSLYTGPFTFDVTTAQQTADFGSGDVSGYVTQFQAVPEPSTWLLISMGLLVVMIRRRRLSI